jgi:hypothetical protein
LAGAAEPRVPIVHTGVNDGNRYALTAVRIGRDRLYRILGKGLLDECNPFVSPMNQFDPLASNPLLFSFMG